MLAAISRSPPNRRSRAPTKKPADRPIAAPAPRIQPVPRASRPRSSRRKGTISASAPITLRYQRSWTDVSRRKSGVRRIPRSLRAQRPEFDPRARPGAASGRRIRQTRRAATAKSALSAATAAAAPKAATRTPPRKGPTIVPAAQPVERTAGPVRSWRRQPGRLPLRTKPRPRTCGRRRPRRHLEDEGHGGCEQTPRAGRLPRDHLQSVRPDHDALTRPPVASDARQQPEEHVRKGPHREDEPRESRAPAAVEDNPGKRDEGEADPEVVAELSPREETAVSRPKQRVDRQGTCRELRPRPDYMIRFFIVTMREQN